jgi:hypothetical protein
MFGKNQLIGDGLPYMNLYVLYGLKKHFARF